MLIDSNIIIYAAKSENQWLRDFIDEHAPSVSAVSYVEVLGYCQLTEEQRQYFDEFFAASRVLPISVEVLDEAVRLRQKRRISLGDSLVAATALVNDLTLVTRNVDDFEWIEGLKILNPFASEGDAA